MDNKMKTDIAIIGGGASGMCSAISAKTADKNLNIVILEKLPRTGTKILSTGNGRCNLGNKNVLQEFFHGSIENFMDIIDSLDTEDFFKSLGVLCRTDNDGRIYPYSNKASSVLDALRIKLNQLNIPEICGFDVKSIEKTKGGFVIKSDDKSVFAKRVIISSGGKSSPTLGTDGKIMNIIKNMGHKVTELCPSLSPLIYKNPEKYKSLAGIRARAKVLVKSEYETGEVQFTANALSGICVFNLSYLKPESVKLDFMPEMSYQEVADFLFYLKNSRCNCTNQEYLSGIFAKNLGLYLIKKSTGKTGSERVSELTSSDVKAIAGAIKSDVIYTLNKRNWNNSQVTAGGVSGLSIDENLQSKILKGMYFSGEILDIDGKCGGYNLMWAWSSGIWAGKKCAESLVQNL